MKRRHAVKMIPLSLAMIAGYSGKSFSVCNKPLGLRYTEKIRAMFEKIKNTQSEEMLEASYRIAQTIKNGHRCHRIWETGHSVNYDFWPDRPGDTDIFVKERLPYEKGDLILLNRTIGSKKLEECRRKGVFVIGGCTPWGGSDIINAELLRPEVQKLKIRPYADIWIETFDTAYGAFTYVPGETAPLGPVTGALGMLTFWIMLSDAARLLAGDNIKFEVYGDEPPLNESAVNVNMARPLGDIYYETVVRQHKTIDNELGDINRIAAMAVHSVLIGGRVYVYSRYEEALCLEAHERRAGLALTRGLWGPPDELTVSSYTIVDRVSDELVSISENFKPTDKDVVIMGIAKPDDPDDLESLSVFKKAGMGTAAIGPATRDGIIPTGRTVPGEVDIHVGAGCDTYGLFALPGIKRKVSPTSGLIQNQIFWTICCQIAEHIVEKTGNAPGVFLNGGLKGGMEKLVDALKTFRKRGY